MSTDPDVPPSLEAASADGKLMPLVVGASALAERAALLPPGVQLPSSAPPGMGSKAGGLAVVLVMDVDGGRSTTPVLSLHLQTWGVTFEAALRVGVANLRRRANPQVKFEAHPTGCRASQWHDGFDATRCALLPALLDKGGMARGGGTGAGAGVGGDAAAAEAEAEATEGSGDIVAVFASGNKMLAARAQNPVAMCLAGDLALDVAEAWATAKAGGAPAQGGEPVSLAPWRLVAVPEPRNAAHPLHMPCNPQGRHPGCCYMWTPYAPRASKGEYSVPSTRDEVEAVLEGARRGRVPVFDAAAAAAATPASAAAAAASGGDEVSQQAQQANVLKAEGNDALKSGKPTVAVAKYSAAIELLGGAVLGAGGSDQVGGAANRPRAVLLANRAFAQLGMAATEHSDIVSPDEARVLATAALGDARAAALFDPTYAKAHHRVGQALQRLGQAEEAAAVLAMAAQLDEEQKGKLREAKAARAARVAAAKAAKVAKAAAKVVAKAARDEAEASKEQAAPFTPPPPPQADPALSFCAAAAWSGARPGFYFSAGAAGVGYYPLVPEYSALPPAASSGGGGKSGAKASGGGGFLDGKALIKEEKKKAKAGGGAPADASNIIKVSDADLAGMGMGFGGGGGGGGDFGLGGQFDMGGLGMGSSGGGGAGGRKGIFNM